MINIEVKIPEKEKSYPISIDKYDVGELRERIRPILRGKKFLVVISEKVDKLYGKSLGFSAEEKFVLKDGEREKNFKNYQRILARALRHQLSRKDAIIAIGGGVVGDLAGFAASTYMRGIDFIQVPTTLLACVDSSVGGKVAVNSKFGKNLVGSFYQPKAVLINTKFLDTLDEKQFKSGLGEVVKYAFIEKSCQSFEEFNFANFLSENAQNILKKDRYTLQKLIEICIKLKISVVEKDEQEEGLRKILNFGHTYGHALETITGYKKFTHGEAVVKGIEVAFELAQSKGMVEENYKYFAKDLLEKFGFGKIKTYPPKKILAAMKSDKKAVLDKVAFILPSKFFEVEEKELVIDEIKLEF